MRGEIYQLLAIDKDGKEYVIKLDNNNKNDKGFLEYIDSITTTKNNEQDLIRFLIKEGKLDNPNVTFVIKYTNRGFRYLPVVYNDLALYELASTTKVYDKENNKEKDEKKLISFVKFFVEAIDDELCNSTLYSYMKDLNEDIYSEINNGNYLDDKILDEFRKYYEAYGVAKDEYASKEEYKKKLIRSLNTYERFRTAYIFYKMYTDSKIKNITSKPLDNTYDIPEMLKYIILNEPKSFNPEIPEELRKSYEQNGMDGVWAIADSEEIIEKGYKFR